VARQRFELAMARQLPGSVMQQDLPSLTETTKREGPQEVPVLLVQANLETPPAILRMAQEKRSEFVLPLAKRQPVLLLVTWVRQRDLFLH
jgi:hypothetical protein